MRYELIIKGDEEYLRWLKYHLGKEHPKTKGKTALYYKR